MLDVLIVCLHGFLGQAEDWQKLKNDLIHGRPDLNVDFYCPNLFEPQHPLSAVCVSFDDFPLRLVAELKQYHYKKIVIVGYSMGGRLALNTLAKQPQFFDRAIFISTNPGLLSVEEKIKRRESDHVWSERFLKDDWESILRDWNQQSVFSGGGSPPDRDENSFSREALSMAMRNWSVAENDISWEELRKIKTPNVWIAGEYDIKYVQILRDLKGQGVGTGHHVVANFGHRIHYVSNELIFEGLQ